MAERVVNAERVEDLISVFGSFDENIKKIEESLNVVIINRGTELKITGDEEAADKAARTVEGLLTLAAKGETIDEQRVRYLITLVKEGNDDQVQRIAKDVVCINAKGKPIKAEPVPTGFNILEYTKKRFGMFTGEDITLKLKVHNSL